MQTIKIMRGPYRQKGHGIGNIFRSLARVFVPVARTVFRASKPLVKNVAKAAGKEVLQMGMDTIEDVASGENVKAAIKKNVRSSSKRMVGKAKAMVAKKGLKGLTDSIKGRGRKRPTQSQQKSGPSKRKKKNKTIFD